MCQLLSLTGVSVAGPREPHGGNAGECVLIHVHHLTQCHPLSSARPQVMCYRCLSQSSLSLSLNCAIVFKKFCNHIRSLSSRPPSLPLSLSLSLSLLSPTTHYHITLSLSTLTSLSPQSMYHHCSDISACSCFYSSQSYFYPFIYEPANNYSVRHSNKHKLATITPHEFRIIQNEALIISPKPCSVL